jgi:hypothetical protein
MDRTTMARTEAAFREVNEAIAATARRFEADEAEFLCECADPSCADRVTADLADYERVRDDATHFLLAPGHEEPQLERIVERRAGYEVVEKFNRTVVRIVRRLDPRRRPPDLV